MRVRDRVQPCDVSMQHVSHSVSSHVGDALLGCAHGSHLVRRDGDKGSETDV